jgi:hypothetical protein
MEAVTVRLSVFICVHLWLNLGICGDVKMNVQAKKMVLKPTGGNL